jgi:hypothetical protein
MFFMGGIPYFLAVIVGYYSIGFDLFYTGLGLGGWVVYILFFFLVWEQRMLCNHCPYYAEEGNRLHCFDKSGLPKTGTYDPSPMTLSDKVQFLIGAAVFVGYPLLFLVFAGQYLAVILAGFGGAIAIGTLVGLICPHCVNFSCPLNRVSKDKVDEFLQRNPVMRKAWEAAGYTMS